ncbi:MAG: hypothetical protein ACLUKQ_04820 [Peptococcaceae bacterium]
MDYHRDIKCGMDVGKMAELGRFDQEFTVYGCAYQEQEEIYYRLSEDADVIYSFIENCLYQGNYTTPLSFYTKISAVPSGMRDDIWLKSKWKLAYQLEQQYPNSYFQWLEKFSAIEGNDAALPIVEKKKEQLDGRYDRKQLYLFEQLLGICRGKKLLSEKSYTQLNDWVQRIWLQMEDDLILKQRIERTLYGFAYLDAPGNVQYCCDADKISVKKKQYGHFTEGTVVTPILKNTYWFDDFTQIGRIKKEFQENLAQIGAEYLEIMQQLREIPSRIQVEAFQQAYTQIKAESAVAGEAFYRFGYLWNLHK